MTPGAGPSWWDDRASFRRALSLLELLIVIVLVAALGALVLPGSMAGLSQRRFDAAVEEVQSRLMLARCEAMRMARPVHVQFDAATGTMTAGTGLLAGASQGDAFLVKSIPDSWATLELPGGMSVEVDAPAEREEPASEAEDRETTKPAEDVQGAQDNSEAGPEIVMMALFLPDGSTLLSRPLVVRDAEGRSARVLIHPFAGTTRVEAMDRAKPPAAGGLS